MVQQGIFYTNALRGISAKIEAGEVYCLLGVVLKYIVQAKTKGIGVIFITHNVHHAWAVGVLNRGTSYGTFKKAEITRERLLQMMAGGEELEELAVELDLTLPTRSDDAASPHWRVHKSQQIVFAIGIDPKILCFRLLWIVP
jgi:hypothetical protein